MFIVGRSPGRLENLIAVGKGSYLNELIEIAGGVNALAGTPLPYPKISLGAMLGLNPDVLVDMGDMAETIGVTDEHKRSVVALWNRHTGVEGGRAEAGVRGGVGYLRGARAAHRRSRRGVREDAASGGRPVSAAFELRGVGMRYGQRTCCADVDLNLAGGVLTAVVGPNGAGKSTLLGILAGLRAGYLGECRFDGVEVSRWKRRSFARRVSFVPQSTRIEFPFTAEEVALMGRAPHAAGLFESAPDRDATYDAMELTDTLHLRLRDFRSLSGGEQQRVILAAALAQSPEVLLLDEPTTFLDIHHQVTLYRILRGLCERGVLVVAVTHDLNLAAAYAHRVVVLQGGRVGRRSAPGGFPLRPAAFRVRRRGRAIAGAGWTPLDSLCRLRGWNRDATGSPWRSRGGRCGDALPGAAGRADASRPRACDRRSRSRS